MTLAICLLILFWLLASFFRVRRSLRWWYQRQAVQLECEAERMREGLLQEMFAVRRSLELALMTDRSHPKEVQQWLTQIETMQQHLEAVTHQLAPPYLGDSLPLAVQFILKRWQVEYPTVCLTMALPSDWQQEPIEQRRLILSFLDAWLQSVMPQLRSEAVLDVSLTQQMPLGQLMIQLKAPNVATLLSSSATELTNLQQLFAVLADGKCYCRKQGSTVIWCYQWRSSCSKPSSKP